MNIVINIDENLIENQQPKIYNLGNVTTSIQNLLDSSTIIITNYRIIILEFTDLDLSVKHAFLNLDDYTKGDKYGLGQDILASDLIYLNTGSGSAGVTPTLQQVLDTGNYSTTGTSLNAVTDISKTIVWMGDSLMAGTSAPTIADRYPLKVCNYLGYTESNLAISGAYLHSTPTSSIPTKTSFLKYLVIGYGTNDLDFGDSASTFQTNLTNFVTNAITSKGWAGSEIILISLPGFQYQSGITNTARVAYNTAISNVATAKSCIYVDLYSTMIDNAPFGSVTNLFLTTDGVHPNTLGTRVLTKLIASAFEIKFNISAQKLIVNGNSEFTNLKLRNLAPISSGNIMGVSDDGKLQVLSGLPDNTVAIGNFNFDALRQSGSIIPTALGSSDMVLKTGSKIASAFNNTLYGEIVPYGSDGIMTFRNRLTGGTIDMYISPSTGTQALAVSISSPSGILKANYGLNISYGSPYIDQSFNGTLYGRLQLYDDSGDTNLRNSYGVFKQFVSGGTAGSQVQTKEIKQSGREILQKGGTFTEIPSSRLSINSTTEGFLLPRMTTTQKNAISSPAQGLMIFDITLSKLCFYSGTAWETITSL